MRTWLSTPELHPSIIVDRVTKVAVTSEMRLKQIGFEAQVFEDPGSEVHEGIPGEWTQSGGEVRIGFCFGLRGGDSPNLP